MGGEYLEQFNKLVSPEGKIPRHSGPKRLNGKGFFPEKLKQTSPRENYDNAAFGKPLYATYSGEVDTLLEKKNFL